MFDITKEFVHLLKLKQFIYEKFLSKVWNTRIIRANYTDDTTMHNPLCKDAFWQNRILAMLRYHLWISIKAIFSTVLSRITNPIRDCTVKSARNAPTPWKTQRITSEELRKFSLEVQAPSRRCEWIFEDDLGVSDLRATAHRSRVPLSGPRVSGKKMIKISTCLENFTDGGSPKPIAKYHRNALHTLIALPDVR